MEDKIKAEECCQSDQNSDDESSDVQVEEEYIEVVGSDQDQIDDNLAEVDLDNRHGSGVHRSLSEEKIGSERANSECGEQKPRNDNAEIGCSGEVLEKQEEMASEESFGTDIGEIYISLEDGDMFTTDADGPWVFLVESQRFRDKVIKQFADKPMSLKRSRQEISSSKRKHHVVIYPVAPDALSDPRLLKIFDICTEVHVDLHNICSDVAGNSRMAGYLQLWFKCLNDINDNISYLRQLGGSSVQVYCDSLAKELSYVDFHEAWKEQYQGSVDTTLIIPFLPSDISEDDLWSIFPLANIIAIPTDCKPDFRYAHVIFPHGETLLSAIESANMQDHPSFVKNLHLVPIKYLLSNKEDCRQQTKKVKEQVETRASKSLDDKKKQTTKMVKPQKSHSIVSRKKRFPQTRNKATSRPTWCTSQTDDMGHCIAVANLLASLGSQAPDVINTLAKALENTQIDEFSSQESIKTRPAAVPPCKKSSGSDQTKSKQKARRQEQMSCCPMSRQNSPMCDVKKKTLHQEQKGQKSARQVYQDKRKPTDQRQRKSKDYNVQCQRNAALPSGREQHQGYTKSSTEDLFDYYTQGLPAFTQERSKHGPSKTKQKQNPNHRFTEARYNDDWEEEYCHNQPRHRRGKTYTELAQAYDFTSSVEDSAEYRMWVSDNLKASNKERKKKSAGAVGGRRKNKRSHNAASTSAYMK